MQSRYKQMCLLSLKALRETWNEHVPAVSVTFLEALPSRFILDLVNKIECRLVVCLEESKVWSRSAGLKPRSSDTALPDGP